MAIPEKSIFLFFFNIPISSGRNVKVCLAHSSHPLLTCKSCLQFHIYGGHSEQNQPFESQTTKSKQQVVGCNFGLKGWFSRESQAIPPQCHPGSKAWLRGGGLRFRWHLILTLSKIESQNHGWGCILPQIFLLQILKTIFNSASFKINNWIYTLRMINTCFVEVQHVLLQDEDFLIFIMWSSKKLVIFHGFFSSLFARLWIFV